MRLDDLKHAQRARVIYLDHCLTWRGQANRKDLMARFGISNAQAALDFRVYLDMAQPATPIYDGARKSYLAAPGHHPLSPSGPQDALAVLTGEGEAMASAMLPKPTRATNPGTIGTLYQAMQSRAAVQVIYTSMSSAAGDGQWIAPTRFTSDGENLHVRAFSFKHGAFRHYLPIRIEPGSSFEVKALPDPLPEDEDWHTRAILWLRPRSDLTEAQARVVRREFGFDGPLLRVETRKALEFFFDKRWGIGAEGGRLERARVDYIREPL